MDTIQRAISIGFAVLFLAPAALASHHGESGTVYVAAKTFDDATGLRVGGQNATRLMGAADGGFQFARSATDDRPAGYAVFMADFVCGAQPVCAETSYGDYGWGAGAGPRPCRANWTVYTSTGGIGDTLRGAVARTGLCTTYTPSAVANATGASLDALAGSAWYRAMGDADAALHAIRP